MNSIRMNRIEYSFITEFNENVTIKINVKCTIQILTIKCNFSRNIPVKIAT